MTTKVLVLGGTSYVAQFLCARFLDGSLDGTDQVELACTVRAREPLDLPMGFELASSPPSPCRAVRVYPGVSVLALETVKAAIDEYNPTVIVNCVALSSPAACERDPTTAHALNRPSELISYLRDRSNTTKRIHYLHFSTDFVYDGATRPPLGYREADAAPCTDHCVYSATKLAFDRHLHAQASSSDLRTTVLRIANVVGGPAPLFHDQPPKFAQWLHRELLCSSDRQETPVRLWSDEVRSFLYVEDLVRVLWQLIRMSEAREKELPTARILNVGGVDAMTRVQFAERFVREYTRLYPETEAQCRPIEARSRASIDFGYRSPLDARLDCSALRDALPEVTFTPTDAVVRDLSRLFHAHK